MSAKKGEEQVVGEESRLLLAARALYLMVFFSGGILMGVEIAGSRILAPSFGTSIFVWGSLIGLFMGAMALGYYVGGRLADAYPDFGLLAAIVSLAGLYTFLVIPYLGPKICAGISLSITHPCGGPLLACAILFFVPSFLMAMVSPFAVKLRAISLSALGGVAGSLYAISTAGSILGTLATAFLFIPLMRVSTTLQGLGLALIAVGLASFILFKRAMGTLAPRDGRTIGVTALILLLGLEGAWLFEIRPSVASTDRLLAYHESEYHDIGITEWIIHPSGALFPPQDIKRWLRFNDNLESGIYPYLGRYKNAVQYTDLLHLPLIWRENPKRLLVVGGGGGIIPMQYRKDYPCMERVDVLELDPKVRDAAVKYFSVPSQDPIIHFHIGDARQNLKKMEGAYDIAILDAYSAGGQIPFHLLTWEFLEEVKAKMAPDGILATNIISAVENPRNLPERPEGLFLAEYKTLAQPHPLHGRSLFKNFYIFPRVAKGQNLAGQEDEYRNVIILATDLPKKGRTEILAKAKELTEGREETRKVKVEPDLYQWYANSLYDLRLDSANLNGIPFLHDDHAPVETLYRPIKFEENVYRVR